MKSDVKEVKTEEKGRNTVVVLVRTFLPDRLTFLNTLFPGAGPVWRRLWDLA